MSEILKMMQLFFLFFLCLAYTVRGQESVEFITLHDPSPEASHNGMPVAVSVQNEYLQELSRCVLAAESWIRTHVLAHYPATNITTIVVGHTLLCEKNQKENLFLILPSIKNLYYSLTRWGLQKEVKVSASFGSNCLHSNSDFYRANLSDTLVKPLLSFLQDVNSPYLVNAHSQISETLLSAHSNAIKNLGFLSPSKINVVVAKSRNHKPTSRKLSFLESDVVYPFPARPKTVAPTQEPTGPSEPAYAANTPLPPLVGDVSLPPVTFSYAPQVAPVVHPGSPHYGPHLPPCIPIGGGGGGPVAAPPPAAGMQSGLWCVAKPSVPAETLQEALDFACGEGGADCEAIQPNGNCYFPDTVVAHAAYAFNSYWQKTKSSGGTCGFGGTAMLINSDPSFSHCRFILA